MKTPLLCSVASVRLLVSLPLVMLGALVPVALCQVTFSRPPTWPSEPGPYLSPILTANPASFPRQEISAWEMETVLSRRAPR